MRPKLPSEIEQQLPEDIVRHIYKYVPHFPKEKVKTFSPQLYKDLKHIQTKELRGTSTKYLWDFEELIFDDFVLR
jgi:hypothetical protein